MLQQTESVEFSHKYESGKKCLMAYRKAIIKKILSPERWRTHPQRSRTIYPLDNAPNSNPIYFNYWNNINAWTYAFYYQNESHGHSWFFKLCPNLMENKFPNWFIEWWDKFGPRQDYLPESIQKEIDTFNQYHPLIRGRQNLPEGKSFLLFMTENSLPWIWRWDVQIKHNNLGLPNLVRTFHYKWWTRGMNTDTTLNEVKAKIQNFMKTVRSQEKKPISNPFLEISKKIHEENPSLSEDEVVIKTMDFMKNQLFETFKAPGDDESMTSAKSVEDDNPFTCLAGESQDPYEDEDPNGATLADYWDGITQLLTKQRKKKGHQ
ncbi:hypothetical protein Vadar_031426 [Vaccinium darrowii]|uniref:Uncharacterized protein n=1 Tax=Vaccinium darrowii TaxID=229202 RepID=A0ACB7Z0Q8_9ERIC|nr:hypothetical protein Vadar_031426 [Vaccinium darrowii]